MFDPVERVVNGVRILKNSLDLARVLSFCCGLIVEISWPR